MTVTPDFTGAYAMALQEAAQLWGANSGECSTWARQALKALTAGDVTPLQLAQTVYAKIKPVDAWGRPARPKVRDDRLSVRNLENATNPAPGSRAARSSLEAVLLIFGARHLAQAEIDRFIAGEGKLFGLRTIIKERLKAAADDRIAASAGPRSRNDGDLRAP